MLLLIAQAACLLPMADLQFKSHSKNFRIFLIPFNPVSMKKRVVGCLLMLVLGYSGFSQTTYTWNGTTDGLWGTPANWTPTRNTLANNDNLIFTTTVGIKAITNIPNETIGSILVTGNTSYTFQSAATSILALTNTAGNAFQLDNGSTLGTGSALSLDINIPASGTASIGGQLTLVKGSFAIGSGTLILHTDPAPLARVGGQVTMSAGAILQFGLDGVTETTPTIVLPQPIFIGSISIASIIMNRANGATLNNQIINLSTGVTFTSGDLNVPTSGTLIFGTAAADPALTESPSSKIVGYAEMLSRVISTGSIDFLGFQMAAGADNLNNIIIKRQTGTPATFNSTQSISAVWTNTTGLPPSSGRAINFKWLSAFDNGYNPAIQFRTFINNGAPGWTELTPQQALASTGEPRISAPVTTTQFNNFDFTLTDQSVTLPVELTSFFARATASNIKLSWQTASEKNNAFFMVEKMNSDNSFQQIAKVIGAGTTINQTNYSFVDEKPRLGDNYYRLKQTDEDGKFVYSHVVHASFDGKPEPGYVLYPNPSDGKHLYFDNATEDFSVSFQDITGNVIFRSNVSAENSSLDITALQLSPGFYFVRTSTKGESQIHKLVVK
jgi:Secretion system C-terminal sorting domain